MRKKRQPIPVNHFGGQYHPGISIEKITLKELPYLEELERSERHDRHTFHLLEKGTITIEIDFEKYTMNTPSVIYMHPDQVHRIMAFKNVSVSSWAITNENLHPEYLALLEGFTPVQPLALKKEAFALMSAAISLSLEFYERSKDQLYHFLLRDSCNVLVALAIAQYAEQSKPADKLSRYELVTKGFKEILERKYINDKRPIAYARELNISVSYLNECVKNTTGYTVSHHIQQRIILEAKRLLYHSDRSVKEIAAVLGYDDYPYFSRLFTKVAGMTALSFRNQNRG